MPSSSISAVIRIGSGVGSSVGSGVGEGVGVGVGSGVGTGVIGSAVTASIAISSNSIVCFVTGGAASTAGAAVHAANSMPKIRQHARRQKFGYLFIRILPFQRSDLILPKSDVFFNI